MKIEKIYLDMDGVLADLNGSVDLMFGKSNLFQQPRDVFDDLLRRYTDQQGFAKAKPTFTASWLDQFYERHCEVYDFEILTSHGNFYPDPKEVGRQKAEWLANMFPETLGRLKVNVTPSGAAKALYARPDCLLIDDHSKNCTKFIVAGGMALKWDNDADSIMRLTDMIDEDLRHEMGG